jgi:hypothetical protein
MFYSPGTIFRVYSIDNSKHYTAVLLKNGSYLEVKNPDNNNSKTVFETLDDWAKSHNVDVSSVIPENKPKLNVHRKGADYKFTWGLWFYNLIKDLDIDLSTLNPEIIEVFNKLSDIWYDYPELRDNYSVLYKRKNSDNYNPNRLEVRTMTTNKYGEKVEDNWCGLPWYFTNENMYNTMSYNSVRNEAVSYYKRLCNLAKLTIIPKMKKRYEIEQTKNRIGVCTKEIAYYDKKSINEMNKIEKKKSELNSLEDYLSSYIYSLKKYKKEINDLKYKLKSLIE